MAPLCTSTSKLQLTYRANSTLTIKYGVEWKSENKGIKETTSIQTDRRGGDVKEAGPTSVYGG